MRKHAVIFSLRRCRLTSSPCPFRLQEPGSLQRISSRRRKRPRISRQDTTESEDDGGRSHKSHRWNLRLSPDRTRSRTILEVGYSFIYFCLEGFDETKSPFYFPFFLFQESISQVRPLVIRPPNAEKHSHPVVSSRGSRLLTTLRSSSLSLPFVLLLSLPLSLSLVIVIVSFFLPWARA